MSAIRSAGAFAAERQQRILLPFTLNTVRLTMPSIYRRITLSACALLATLACVAQDSSPARTPDEQQAREIFRRVIGFKSSIGLGQVPPLAAYLAGEFRAAGFADADIHIVPLGETASLLVRYRGDGSGGKPILLMAHMDVVTAKREDWQRDPFTLVEENGFFYGRGTLDIKVGVAELTATLLRLKREGFVPRRDLVLVFSGDEETLQDTIRDLAKNHRELIDAEYALNSDAGGGVLDEATGQPLIYGLQTAEKTYTSYELTVRNPGGHSSQPRPDNAIYELADALKKVQAYRFPVMWSDTTIGYMKATGEITPGKPGEMMRRFAANPQDQVADDYFYTDFAHVGITRTTCIPTLLRGGHADNALPQSATATINCRIFPGVDPAAVKTTLAGIVGPAVEITVVGPSVWSDASPLRPDVVGAVTRAVLRRHPGIKVVPKQESGATDGIYLRAVGIPTYGVSDTFIKDSDDFSHGLNERLPVKSFYDGLDYWHALLTDLAGPPRP